MSTRRRFLASTAAAGLAPWLPQAARAQGRYPSRVITLVDPFSPGGSSDLMARLLAESMGPALGGTVIVENRAGAGGSLGADHVAKAAPDGYTLGLATVSTLVTGPAVNPKVSYDPLRQFTHISKLVQVPSILAVHSSVPVQSLKELVELARRQPGSLAFSTPGVGSAGHVLLEQFMQVSGARFLHVPYRGSAGAINDLLSGQVQVMSDNMPSILPHVLAGKVRAIAVRDLQRLPLLPEVPTYAEAGYAEVSQPLWFGVVGPAGLPPEIVTTLNQAVHKAVQSTKFSERLKATGATAAPGTPEAFRAEAGAMLERYRQVVKTANITV